MLGIDDVIVIECMVLVVNESRLAYHCLHCHDCRCTMSELFMECVEEELEPWQKQVPQVNLIDDDDDDDEPIFVGVLCKSFCVTH